MILLSQFLQAFVMLILLDLTSPDLTSKPDLKTLFLSPTADFPPV